MLITNHLHLHLLLITISISIIFANQASCSFIVNSIYNRFLGRVPNYTGYMLWNMIPDESRLEILNFYVKNVKIGNTKEAAVVVPVADSFKDISEIDHTWMDLIKLKSEKYENDWFKTAAACLIDDKLYNIKSQFTFLATILEKAPASAIQRILKNIKYCREIILQKISIDPLIKFILNTPKSGDEKVALLNIIQMYANVDFANLKYLNLIRDAAFKLDDKDLLEFTNDYSDILKNTSVDDQERIMDNWKVDHFPNLWEYVCSNAKCNGAECKHYSKNNIMKFNVFSDALDTNGWNLAMFATACKRYNEVSKMPSVLLPKASANNKIHTPGKPFTCMEHLIPMIEDATQREKLCEMFDMPAQTEMKESVDTVNSSKRRIWLRTVTGINDVHADRYKEQPLNEYDIETLVDETLAHENLVQKTLCSI